MRHKYPFSLGCQATHSTIVEAFAAARQEGVARHEERIASLKRQLACPEGRRHRNMLVMDLAREERELKALREAVTEQA